MGKQTWVGPGAATWHVLWIKLQTKQQIELQAKLQTELQTELQTKLQTELQIELQTMFLVCESEIRTCELSCELKLLHSRATVKQ